MERPTDEQITRRLRAELDALTAGIPETPPAANPAARGAVMSPSNPNRNRWIAGGIAAAAVALLVAGLIVLGDRDPDAPAATVPSDVTTTTTTVVVTDSTGPLVTAPSPTSGRYEAVGTVLGDAATQQTVLCVGGVAESLPPQCSGVTLIGWSWLAVDDEQTEGDVTWGDVYLTGDYDTSNGSLVVATARDVTPEDYDRLQPPVVHDFTVPCPEPEGGWPARNQEWPAEIAAIEGYAGAWVDASQQVMTVKFTGDLAAAEAAVRQYYSDAVCFLPATHTEAELLAIQNQLMSLSSVQVYNSAVYVDATGEWVQAELLLPDPDRQASFDTEYGEGTVRLTSVLHPIDG